VSVSQRVFTNLSALYDLGNNYVHPKAGHDAKEDSLKALHLIGESLFEIYGVRGIDDLIGKKLRTPYSDFPDICGGHNFWLIGFVSPEAALEHTADDITNLKTRMPTSFRQLTSTRTSSTLKPARKWGDRPRQEPYRCMSFMEFVKRHGKKQLPTLTS
jgi:hypothetical protein